MGAPVIEEGVSVKKVDRAPLLNDIAEGAELKKTETVDKSGPVIDSDVKVKPSARPALLGEIQHKGVTSEIATGVTLKKAETVDKSGPVIEEGVTVKKSARPALLEEIKKKGDA